MLCRQFSTQTAKVSVSAWIDRAKERFQLEKDFVSASQIQLFNVTIDQLASTSIGRTGDIIGPARHFVLFPNRVPANRLSADGYDDFCTPPHPFDKRMWAGGKMEWEIDNPLRIGQEVVQETRVDRIDLKQGARGSALFTHLLKITRNEIGTTECS